MNIILHYKHTEEAYREFAAKFNEEMKTKHKKDFSKFTLKKTHHGTFLKLLAAYGKHLDNLRNSGQPFSVTFRINNEALATMLDCDPSTVSRHISRFMAAGIILNKEWHGTNSSFELTLNPQILIAATNAEMTSWLVENYSKTVQNPVKNPSDPLFSRPAFALFFPSENAKCKHIELQETLKNTNMCSGIQPAINALFKNSDIKSETGNLKNKKHESTDKEKISAQKESNVAPAAPPNVAGASDRYGRQLTAYIDRALHFVLMVLYNHRAPSGAYLTLTYEYLRSYFSNAVSYQTKLEEFLQVVMLTEKYIKKHPEWEQPPVWTWLNPENKGGIRGAEKYFREKIIPQRKIRKDYYENLHLLSQCIRNYIDKPSIETYRVCTQKLGKKQKGILLDTFNKCVIDKTQFSKENFSELKRQFLKQ